MKMKKILFALPFIISSVFLPVYAQAPTKPISEHKCTSNPCGNTATGEDPQEQRIREGEALNNKIRDSADDKNRWRTIPLYSDSSKPNELSLPVVKTAGLEMRLDPKLGQLTFSKTGMQQTFLIASPRGTKNSSCPEYSIEVIEASAAHALIRKTCFRAEYAPGRYSMSIEYYLYDAETAVMRNIWRATVSDKKAHMPDAKPTPTLKTLPNGYRFDWSGIQPSDSPPSTTTIHNSYVRNIEKVGEKELLCTNLSAPKGQGIEDEMCEGGILPRVGDKSIKR